MPLLRNVKNWQASNWHVGNGVDPQAQIGAAGRGPGMTPRQMTGKACTVAHVVVLGGGLGGTIAAYELREKLGPKHQISIVTNGDHFNFVPSNPWVGAGWRDREAVAVELVPAMAKRDIALHTQGAIPPMGKTAVPVGVPKTGFMIESMVTATVHNIDRLIKGEVADAEATWNAFFPADFGDGGIAFVAQPQIPPRNVNWSSSGKLVHAAKIAFEKYFLYKVRRGVSEPFYESFAMRTLGINKLKEVRVSKTPDVVQVAKGTSRESGVRVSENWISRFDGLSRLEPAVRDVLMRKSAVVTVPADTVIFGPGKSPQNLLLLLEGRVRVQQLSEAGREIVR